MTPVVKLAATSAASAAYYVATQPAAALRTRATSASIRTRTSLSVDSAA